MQAGLSAVSGYLRSVGLAQTPAACRPSAADPSNATLREVLRHIGWLGSNVNQLARAFNTDASTPEAVELAAIRAEVLALRSAVSEALGLPA